MAYREYERLLTKISTLYFIEEKSQYEIAELLGLSRSKVCRMIADAKSSGIVQIIINAPISSCYDLEVKFEKTFNLREAIILNNASGDNTQMMLGQAGAEYIKRITSKNDVIGISWGKTLYNVINYLQPFDMDSVRIVQLVGGLNSGGQNVQAAELARRMGQLFGSNPELLYCPAVVTNPQVKFGLLQDENINRVFELGKKATIGLVGIGNVSMDSQLFSNNYLSSEWREKLINNGAVGDICMRFYDINGLPCCEELDQLSMSISLEDLKDIKTVVCIASGLEKAKAILGALRGKIPDVLITDRGTAEKILELSVY